MAHRHGNTLDVKLPQKEAKEFRAVIKNYENKQYKKALKGADAILKKHPNNGETLAAKGLLLVMQNKSEEGLTFSKRGVKNDVQSYLVWHLYGLTFRHLHDYPNAIKCYHNALRCDPENMNIIRDLALLQIQMRDLEGYLKTRTKIIKLKPNFKVNWLAFAVGCLLNGDHEKALQTLEVLDYIQDTSETKNSVETSELLLFKNFVLEEKGDIAEALRHLESIEKQALDKLYIKEKKASYLMKLGQESEAEKIYRDLLKVNPENYKYYALLESSLKLEKTNSEGLTKLYQELEKEFPKVDTIPRLLLNVASGETFKSTLDTYMKNKLRKGVPFLWNDLKSLYRDPAKVQVLEKLALDYETALQTSKTFPQSDKKELPAVLMWTKFFLSQHYNAKDDWALAFDYIDQAIKHTPTLPELYLQKGKIYKRAGNLPAASEMFEFARNLDLADRYLNTKSCKYLLRLGQIEKATEVAGKFTKEGEPPEQYLNDMQTFWYNYESGKFLLNNKQYGGGLKKLHAIERHYIDMEDDQFDFHQYCLRKLTLRAYVSMVRLEDDIFGKRNYVEAMLLLTRGYLEIHRSVPSARERQAKLEEETKTMSPQDKKNYLARKKKEDRKEEEERERLIQQQKTEWRNRYGPNKQFDEDPQGLKLLDADGRLDKAAKLVKTLQTYAPNDVRTHLLAAEVYVEKKKPLLALRGLVRAHQLAPTSAELHLRVVQFFCFVETAKGTLPPSVSQLIEENRKTLLSGAASLDQFNSEFVGANKASLLHRIFGARAMLALHPEKKADALKLATNLEGAKGATALSSVIQLFSSLKSEFGASEQEVTSFQQAANKVFPFCSFFSSTAQNKNQ